MTMAVTRIEEGKSSGVKFNNRQHLTYDEVKFWTDYINDLQPDLWITFSNYQNISFDKAMKPGG